MREGGEGGNEDNSVGFPRQGSREERMEFDACFGYVCLCICLRLLMELEFSRMGVQLWAVY